MTKYFTTCCITLVFLFLFTQVKGQIITFSINHYDTLDCDYFKIYLNDYTLATYPCLSGMGDNLLKISLKDYNLLKKYDNTIAVVAYDEPEKATIFNVSYTFNLSGLPRHIHMTYSPRCLSLTHKRSHRRNSSFSFRPLRQPQIKLLSDLATFYGNEKNDPITFTFSHLYISFNDNVLYNDTTRLGYINLGIMDRLDNINIFPILKTNRLHVESWINLPNGDSDTLINYDVILDKQFFRKKQYINIHYSGIQIYNKAFYKKLSLE